MDIQQKRHQAAAKEVFFLCRGWFRKSFLKQIIKRGLKPVHQMTEAEWDALGNKQFEYPSYGAAPYNTNYYICALHNAVQHGVALAPRIRKALSPCQRTHLNYLIRETYRNFPKGKYSFFMGPI